jgi:tRNA A37 N6-isopentenylltransferase MiaA
MVITYERVKTAAARLSSRKRSRLAHRLSRFVTPTRREIQEEWAKEIQRRVAEIDAGTAILIDGDEVIAEIRRALERVRQEKAQHSTPEIENAWLDEVEQRIRLQDAGLIDDIDADDLYREFRDRLR